MTWYKKFVLLVWWNIKFLLDKAKIRIWNKYILLWWYRLWIRKKDEFSRSLDIDIFLIFEMNKQERKKYLADLVRRRKIACLKC